mgnify:CR=1 FL=1
MYILVNVVNIAFSIIGRLFESINEHPNVLASHIVVFAANTKSYYLPISCQKYDMYA